MAVIVGSARHDENGKAYGGQAGDQIGKECSTQNWYKHSKGWVVLRAKDPAKAALMAKAMKAACDNSLIGYDQWQRNTLYNAVKVLGFDVTKLAKAVETDCSALVRVCMGYAGIPVAEAFRTTEQASVMMRTGEFIMLTDAKYTEKSDYLKVGDVLVTKTQGHTVIVLSNGPKAEQDVIPVGPSKGNPYSEPTALLKYGAEGNGVKWLQYMLTELKYPCGEIDGDFGKKTLTATKDFQTAENLEVDGKVGALTRAALKKAVEAIKPKSVLVTGNSVNVRDKADTTGKVLGVTNKGDTLPYTETASTGWNGVTYKGMAGWISNNYSKVVE